MIKNCYMIIGLEHPVVKGVQKHVIITGVDRVWITDEWYNKNDFKCGDLVSLKWDSGYKRYGGVFPYREADDVNNGI